ncbi:protein of unknown function [Sphingobacterium nematocida]|uniref:DUF4843 domain-containing protein n=1 Tax=Sphingobacterium nematocida TaxID=1513896 RepID=A0A1T5AUK5_9SPHI|nr:DUF4843 domain-containing protein [Sphingobacterium nematocida]SKB38605.1 protein of unknown function [Sphingobacterium nematocida]
MKFNLYKLGTYSSIGMVCFAAFFSSCEKGIMSYEGVEGIYFAVQGGSNSGLQSSWPFIPTSKLQLGNVSGSDTTIHLKVMVTGPVKKYDRSFQVVINPEVTTAEINIHYKPLADSYTIPAGQVLTYVPITILRTGDLKLASKQIGLRLVPNEQLGLSFPDWDAIPGLDATDEAIVSNFDASIHEILISDYLPRPGGWSGLIVEGTNEETGNWGNYSEKKLLLMCELMNLTYDSFSTRETMPAVLINLTTREMVKYLTARMSAGDPIVEEDGRLMWVTGVSWKSYVGVPYKK